MSSTLALPLDSIDAVVAWVDGNDPRHQAKLGHHLAAIGHRPPAAHPTRFRSVGEIDFCIASILRFAPFVRRIHIVTDEQVPPVFEAARAWDPALREKLVLVDHRDVFAGFEDCLPTFNARSIESVLWRIPGLAEQFVYFNDDMLLIRDIEPGDWFRDDQPVLYGRYLTPVDREWGQRAKRALRWLFNQPKPPSPLHQRSQSVAAARVGFHRQYYSVHHCPHPLRRSTFARYFSEHPEALRENISHRLRSAAQFGPVALANHLEIQAGDACMAPDDRLLYAEPPKLSRTGWATLMQAAERNRRLVFACLQSLDEAEPQLRDDVLDWLDRAIGRNPQPPYSRQCSAIQGTGST